jgi:hypothetical protein
VASKAPAQKTGRDLVDYVMAKRRASCKVCQLPDALRAQIAIAREKKIERRIVREWLKAEHNVEIAESEFTSHSAAHHEEGTR